MLDAWHFDVVGWVVVAEERFRVQRCHYSEIEKSNTVVFEENDGLKSTMREVF